MDFNTLLREAQIDPKQVVVLRHRPHELALRKVFPWLVAERRDLFDAFQKTHGEPVESSLLRAGFVASFVAHGAGKALFVGLYQVIGSRPISYRQYWQMPEYKELAGFGMQGLDEKRESVVLFDLQPTGAYAEWSGRLICDWPGGERSWRRWADKNSLAVRAITEESLFVSAMPDWHEVTLSWLELKVLPQSWKSALRHWRGIYYLRDQASGKGYVGSAYGSDNLLGRWLGYGATGHGGNQLLKSLDPNGFRFSILQRVSPDMDADEVIALEGSWKRRLQTLFPDGLNKN